jgi:hypothetical protein
MMAPEWVVEQWPGSVTISAVRSHGIREGHPQDETVYYVYSLRTGVKAPPRTIRQRWSIKNSWHWVRDVPLREDAHCYREINGVQILATRRSLAINALSLDGFWSITDGIAALAHDIKGLLRLMGWRQPAAGTRQNDYLQALPRHPGAGAITHSQYRPLPLTTQLGSNERLNKSIVFYHSGEMMCNIISRVIVINFNLFTL